MSEPRKTTPGPKPQLNDTKIVNRRITMYFDSLLDKDSGDYKAPPTFSGLTLALHLNDTRALWRYANGEIQTCKPEIMEAVKRACLKIDEYHETRIAGAKQTPIGSIFVLKNRHWRDQQDVKHEGEISTVTRMELPPKRPVGERVKPEKVSRNSSKKTAAKK